MNRIREIWAYLRLNRKMQLSLMLIIVPLFILLVAVYLTIYSYNQQYDRIIAVTAEAGRFSINFRDEIDYKIYLIVVGNSTFEEEKPYESINEAKAITSKLIQNTSLEDNRLRAETIMKLLGNLEKYVRQIEENKSIGGRYDENISIWNDYVQIVTNLIQSNVLEYTFYETKAMDQVRMGLSESIGRITLLSLIIFVVLFALALFLSVVVPNSIVKPIHHLNDITNQVAKGDLTVRANVKQGAEVIKLGESLNSMIEKIDNLLTAVKIDEKNLREAELELLQSQINPHFLYNTLDTIIWLAESGQQGQVVDMVGSLSNFFRTSLNHGKDMVTLKEEEIHIRSYLQIQHVRYQDILEYEIDLPETVKEALIPKITLQPLVENALYHGIKNKRGKGLIRVSAEPEDDSVIIAVHDNGIGMSEERLQEIIARLSQKASSTSEGKRESYGLYNVNERIRLRFGDCYGLSISSTFGVGTCVQVRIPRYPMQQNDQ